MDVLGKEATCIVAQGGGFRMVATGDDIGVTQISRIHPIKQKFSDWEVASVSGVVQGVLVCRP